jgi:ATP-binding cassette, subfamily C, bacterial
MRSVAALWRLLGMAPQHQVLSVLVLMVLGSVTDGIGIVLLVPLLALLDRNASENPLVQALVWGLEKVGIGQTVGGLLAAFVVLMVLRGVIQFAKDITSARLQNEIVDDLRGQCLKALLAANWRWISTRKSSDHANLVLTEISRIGTALNNGLGLLATLLAMLALVASAMLLSAPMTLLILVTGFIVFAMMSKLRGQAYSLGGRHGRANRALFQTLQESLSGIKLSKILGNEARHLGMLNQTIAQVRQEQLLFQRNSSLSRALFQVFAAAMLSAYVYFGVTRLNIALPELLTLVFIFSRLVPLFMTAQQQMHQWLNALPAIQEAELFLQDAQAAREMRHVGADLHVNWPIQNKLELCDVVVSYADRTTPALAAVTVVFPAHSITAVMGPSGSGKSTLADVVMGLIVPDTGSLLVDGEVVSDQTRTRWMRSVAYVPQDSFLFHDSIRNNLLWAQPTATQDELLAALHAAAAEFVLDHPEGLDAIVGDGGIRFSGGERQRLALARALLQRPSLLIMDEATSALDPANEAKVYEAIGRLAGKMTIILISHSPETARYADRVLVLQQGSVARVEESRFHANGQGDDE